MFAEFVMEFVEYLNQNGYSITPDKTKQYIEAFIDEDMDCTDAEDVISSAHMYFCKDIEQRWNLRNHFHEFVAQRKFRAESKKTQEEMAYRHSESKKKQEQMEKELSELKKEAEAIKEAVIKEWKSDPASFSKQEKTFLEKKKKLISSLKINGIDDVLSGKAVTEKDAKSVQEKVMKAAEKAMTSGQLNKFKDLNTLFKIVQKVKRVQQLENPRRNAAIRKASAETNAKIRQLEIKRVNEIREQQEIQRKLNEKMKQLKEHKLIQKPGSVTHRELFRNPSNAVQVYGGTNYPPEAEKEFITLTDNDKNVIRKYILENILKFKTRMTRNIMDMSSGKIDIAMTIKDACRTGGMPFHIFKELKRPGKANLVLVLDVSGSCKEASEMMITFMYLLKEVFPRGCKVFAFVNSLYDITGIMDSDTPELAIKETLTMIPRTGQYSNYEYPLKTLWNDYHSSLNKDSIVIMIGDARNNRNQPAEEEFKNIVHRVKKFYWLNTDKIENWGEGDSIAPKYGRYCKMYEVRTPKAIVQFLNNRMR